jgi:hypothetical protein
MVWAVVDTVEAALMFFHSPDEDTRKQVIFIFAFHALSIFLVIWGIAIYEVSDVDLTLMNLYPGISLYFLAATVLRLGVFPFHAPFVRGESLQRGLGTMVRLSSSATSLMLLARISGATISDDVKPFLVVFLSICALIGGFRWIRAADELKGRPYLILALAAFAYTSAVLSQPWACVAWSLALILPASMLYLSPNRQRNWLWLPVLGVLLLSGVPFSPVWGGLRLYQKTFLTSYSNIGSKALIVLAYISFWAAHSIFIAGFVRHALTSQNQKNGSVFWVRGMNLLGILLLPIIHIAMGIRIGLKYSRANLWIGAIALCGAILILLYPYLRLFYIEVLMTHVGRYIPSLNRAQMPIIEVKGTRRRLSGILHHLGTLLSLTWLYRMLLTFFYFVQRLYLLINRTLEGDGGVLWSILVFMLLLAVIFRS